MNAGRRVAGLAGPLLLVAGCADRGLASGPTSPTGAGTWLAVAVAAGAAIVVLAALTVVRARHAGAVTLAEAVLAIQAGAAVVGASVLVGAALRSERLVTQPEGAEQAASLLRLTGLDGGDTGFFRLLAGLTVVLGLLVVAVLVLAARFAGGADPVERVIASVVLALESIGAAGAIVLLALGYRGPSLVIAVAALPVLLVAAWRCWPRSATSAPLGYNEAHG